MRAFSSRAVWFIGGSLLLVLALILLAPVCGTVDASLAGEWHGYGPMAKDAEDPLLARNIAAVRLDLETGGKFRLVDGGLPFGGKWRRTGDVLTFDVETIMERPLSGQTDTARKAAKAFTANVQARGTELRFHALSGNWVVLKRETAPRQDP